MEDTIPLRVKETETQREGGWSLDCNGCSFPSLPCSTCGQVRDTAQGLNDGEWLWRQLTRVTPVVPWKAVQLPRPREWGGVEWGGVSEDSLPAVKFLKLCVLPSTDSVGHCSRGT